MKNLSVIRRNKKSLKAEGEATVIVTIIGIVVVLGLIASVVVPKITSVKKSGDGANTNVNTVNTTQDTINAAAGTAIVPAK